MGPGIIQACSSDASRCFSDEKGGNQILDRLSIECGSQKVEPLSGLAVAVRMVWIELTSFAFLGGWMLGEGLVNKVRSVGESVVAKAQAHLQVWFRGSGRDSEGRQPAADRGQCGSNCQHSTA